MESLYETLEFDVLRDHLAGLAVSYLGRDRVHNIQPFSHLTDLQKSLDQTTELRDILDYDETPPLDEIADLRPILKKCRIVGSMLHPEECGHVLHFITLIRYVDRFFKDRTERIPTLRKITTELIPLKNLETKITTCIDPATLEIKNSASSELASIRKSIARAEVSARKKMESMLKSFGDKGMLQENLISVRGGRLVLVVKDEYRRKVKGLVHDQSATGSSFFIEPLSVVDDNNRVRELQSEETKEIERILRCLTDDIREEQNAIERNLALFGDIDFVYAQARLSKKLNAFQPELQNEAMISLVQARHPLLLLRMGDKNVVPLDINLGEENHTLIISGPNAGGKTVALKTVGLLTLMISCGLHIPAQPHSKIGLLTQIFANIGDQQSLENDLSTFSSHLQGLKDIAENADERSLVLIDEIGSGTDPEEGIALAVALLERLTQRHCLSIVTTHQSPLKAFAYETKGVGNASLEFDIASLEPTYRFRTGIPGSSYAFEIAQRMGLPVDMTERARELIGSHKEKLEGLILELEERIQSYAEMAKEAGIKETEYRGLLKLYREKYDALVKETNAIKRQALEEAEALLNESNAAVEKVIREIRESEAKKEDVKISREKIQVQRQKISKYKEQTQPQQKEPASNEPIENGDYVSWQTTGGVGQVISNVDKKGRVMVQFDGGMKANVLVQELSKNKKKRQTKSKIKFNVHADKRFSRELDIRGMLGEEAIELLDQFLDEALLADFHEVSVIHGKGTGKLRTHVGQYLQKHAQVKGFRLGYWNEGDSGVTVIKLKEKKKESTIEQE